MATLLPAISAIPARARAFGNTPKTKARQHGPEREAVEEGRDRGRPPKPIGEQEPNMSEGDEQAGEAEKSEVPVLWRLPGLETERHGRCDDHHHDIGCERHNHHRNARRHVTPGKIARRDQQSRREGEQSGG
jgi:hypothetical protein